MTEALLAQDIAVMPGTALLVAADHEPVGYPYGLRIGLGAKPEEVALAARAAATLISAGRDTRVVSGTA